MHYKEKSSSTENDNIRRIPGLQEWLVKQTYKFVALFSFYAIWKMINVIITENHLLRVI